MTVEAEQTTEQIVAEAYASEAAPAATLEGAIVEPQSPSETADQSTSGSDSGRTLKYKGEELSMDDDKYRNFAQKGYDYEQKMHQFRVDGKLREQEFAEKAAQYSELEAINNYAKENPAFEKLIQEQWALVQSGQQPQVSPQNQMEVLQSQVNQLMGKLESQESAMESKRVAEMEATQEGAIEKYKSDHGDLDWEQKDDLGLSLEDRIGQAMIDNGVKNFNIMADSFLMKEHLTRAGLKSKESLGKEIQKKTHLGLGEITKNSQLSTKKADDVSNKSYDQLIREGLEELGIAY